MKTPGLILILLLPSLISYSQIERKPVPAIKADTVAGIQPAGKVDKADRKDLLKELDLTREQNLKLKEIRQANKTKKEAIESNGQLSEDEKKKQFRELQKEQAKAIQAILTDEQKEKFKAKRQEAMKENN